ncbi:MAG TPA: hypothetical protein VGD69_30445 [Herpetosiphonaceae bacterium]
MKNLKLVLVIVVVALVAGLGVGSAFYMMGNRSNAASAEGDVHIHADGTEHIHGPDDHGEGDVQTPLMASVERVEGKTIFIREAATGLLQKFDLTPDARIHRQELAQLSDVQPGTIVTALGPDSGGVIQADIVLVGKEAVMGSRLPLEEGVNGGAVAAAPGAPGSVETAPGAPGAVEVAPGAVEAAPSGSPAVDSAFRPAEAEGTILLPEPIEGTVEQVDGNTITMKSADGKTIKVQVGSNAQFQKYVDAQASEIAAGKSIMVLPPSNGDVMRVRILLSAAKP